MPTEKTNIVRGTLRDRSKNPASKLLIRAYDDTQKGRSLLGTSLTSEKGTYSIAYAYAQLKKLNLVLSVYSPDGILIGESKHYNDVSKTKTVDIFLGKYPADVPTKEKNYTLYGQIRNEKGENLEYLIVEARDISMSKEPILGTPSMSLEDGSYRMHIKDTRPEKSLDIRLDVLDASGKVLVSIERYNIPPSLELHIHVPSKLFKKVSEYEKLETVLLRYAKENHIDLQNIPQDEIKKSIIFLARKSRWDTRLVGMYLMALHYADEAIPAVFYYVLFRADVSSQEEALYRVNLDKVLELFGNAQNNNIIPKKKYDLDKLKSTWQSKASHTILKTNNPSSLSSMDEMLSLSLKTNKEKETFLSLFYHGESDAQQTWKNIENKFDAKTVKNLRLTSQLGHLSFNNAGLIKKLQKDLKLTDPIELIKHGFHEEEAWDKYIDDKVLESMLLEGDIKEKRAQYKTWMSEQLKQSYPTAIIAEKVNNNTLKIDANTQVKKEVYTALYKEDFVLGKTPIRPHIKKLGNVSKDAETVLLRMDRTLKLSSNDTEVMGVLLEEKLDSAYVVSKHEKKAFVEKYQRKLGSTQKAYAVYNKAYTTASLNANLILGYATQQKSALPAAVAKPIGKSSVKIYPKLDELFGSLDFCTCGHCESVLSPAAYLVSVLEFVKKSDLEDGNPQKRLFEKRPDIAHIKLSCENTKTVLPYIDLVNEILEYWVAHNNIENFRGFNTEEESTESLIAQPTHIIAEVYETTLSEAVFPLSLPFNREIALDNAYSKELSVPPYVRMEVMLKDDSFEGYKDVFIAQLGLSKISYEVLVDTTSYPVIELLGVEALTSIHNAKIFCTLVDIDYSDLPILLKTKFMNPENIQGTDEAINLIPVDASKKEEHCNFETLKLAFASGQVLTELAYLKFVRFIRLVKHFGWGIEKLDKILSTLVDFSAVTTKEALDTNFELFIITIALYERLKRTLNITEDALLVIWTDMGIAHTDVPTLEEISQITGYQVLAKALKVNIEELYDLMLLCDIYPLQTFSYVDTDVYIEPDILKFVSMARKYKASHLGIAKLNYLFRDKDVTGKAMPKPSEWLNMFMQLRSGLKEIEATYPTDDSLLSDEKAQELLTAAYGENGAGAILSIFHVFVVPYQHHTQLLEGNISNQSDKLQYKHDKKELSFVGIMSKTLKNDIETEANSIQDSAIREDFIKAIGSLYTYGKTSYTTLIETYPELLDIHDTYPTVKTLVIDRLPALVQKLKKSFILQSLSSQFNQESPLLSLLTQKLISKDADVSEPLANSKEPMMLDFLALEHQGGLLSTDTKLSFYLMVDASAQYAFQLDGLPTNTQLSSFTIDDTEVNMEAVDVDKSIYRNRETIELKANTAYVFHIVSNKSLENATLKQKAGERLREPVAKEKMFSYETMNTYKHSYIRLFKALEWMQAISFAPEEVAYFAKENLFDLIPVESNIEKADLKKLYAVLSDMLHYKHVKKHLGITGSDLVAFMKNPTATYTVESTEISLLYKLTTWKKEEVEKLIAYFKPPPIANPEKELADISLLHKVSRVIGLTETMGLTADELLQVQVDKKPLESILQNKYDKVSWLKLTQKIYDTLRIKQRDALVTYILEKLKSKEQTKHIDTPDKLFEYFLIDVQMDSCMKTSRIKQAISSVQLFVDRCLYNLEPNILPEAIDAKMWEWMKRYRVWEASRKIFLHPENWLDPSLRSTKSSFFKELEGELLQADINDDLATQALLGYLEKVDRVSQLEICGMCRDDDKRLHVIARTPGMKKVYYYRTYDGTWSPWEKISLDLEDGPVIPVWWEGRLFLFWTTLMQKGQDNTVKELTGKELDKINGPVKLKIELNLNWSEYYNGKWQEKRMSDFNNPIRFCIDGEFNKNDIQLEYRTTDYALYIIPKGKNLDIGTKSFPKYKNFKINKSNSIPEIEEKVYGIPFPSRNLNSSSNKLVFKEQLSKADYNTYIILDSKHYKVTDSSNFYDKKEHMPFFVNTHKNAFFVDIKTSFNIRKKTLFYTDEDTQVSKELSVVETVLIPSHTGTPLLASLNKHLDIQPSRGGGMASASPNTTPVVMLKNNSGFNVGGLTSNPADTLYDSGNTFERTNNETHTC